jgi:1,4-dihydroxy-2-naphthoate octaprenyltransferase
MTVQLGTNLHNDYADYCRGADTDKRVGHARATAKGWLTPTQTCVAATAVLATTLLSGIYLLHVTDQLGNGFLWFLILSSIFNAFAYTGGPFPLGYVGLGEFSIAYSGLGDLFVFLYFGLVATLMLPYLLSLQPNNNKVDWQSQGIYGAQVGLLATNIIVVNNLRDRITDVAAHKMTTAVRFGRGFSILEYKFFVFLTYSLVLLDTFRSNSVLRLLPLLSLPVAVGEARAVETTDGAALNKHVGGAAKVQVLFCILLSTALVLS